MGDGEFMRGEGMTAGEIIRQRLIRQLSEQPSLCVSVGAVDMERRDTIRYEDARYVRQVMEAIEAAEWAR